MYDGRRIVQFRGVTGEKKETNKRERYLFFVLEEEIETTFTDRTVTRSEGERNGARQHNHRVYMWVYNNHQDSAFNVANNASRFSRSSNSARSSFSWPAPVNEEFDRDAWRFSDLRCLLITSR
mmetsp:Transcript_33619/g.39138  ORF Transcript_33619/g.39138 Transcript_33619/m.39138 type:complete len:123 (+) Transcript_33619:184-552(+)